MEDRIRKWRLILGRKADPASSIALDGHGAGMDQVLEALYDSDREGNLGKSSPGINRWLGDIRHYFPTPVVRILQKDAMDKLGIERMLLEPELLGSIEPDVELAATLLTMNKLLPAKTRQVAREVVAQIVRQTEKKLRFPLYQAVQGSLHRSARQYRPKLKEIDWHRTIRANLKHFQPERKILIPERLIGFGKKRQQLKEIILLIDQSGSMASSVVYGCILGSVLASIPALKTRLIVFDTNVVDLTGYLSDPVELLFATQLGGGTHIAKAIAYALPLIQRPQDSIVVLLSDLYEGGPERTLYQQVKAVLTSGAHMVCLLALNDQGAPAFDRSIASGFASLGIPAFACTPDQFPDLIAAAIQKEEIRQWMGRVGITPKN